MKINASPQTFGFLMNYLKTLLEKDTSLSTDEYDALIQNATFGAEIKEFYEGFFGHDAKGNVTNAFKPSIVAEFIAQSIPFVIIDNIFYIYSSGAYIPDEKEARIRMIINNLIIPEKRGKTKLSEVIVQLKSLPKLMINIEDANQYPDEWICFKNGMYDPLSKKIIPHDPKYICINMIPCEFHPEEKTHGDLTDKFFLELCKDEKNKRMLLAFIGLCMGKDTRLQKSFVIFGMPGTGKSVVFRYAEELIGKRNRSSLSLEKICTNRFAAYGLMGKTFNACPDISARIIEDPSIFKNITGEDSISVERKCADQFSIKPYAKLMYSANDLPPIQAKDDAFFRRLLMIHVTSKPKERSLDFEPRLFAEKNHLLHLCMDALSYMYSLGDMTRIETDESKALTKYWETKGNTVVAFIADRKPFEHTGTIEKAEFERQYIQYCQDEERKSLTKNNLKQTMLDKGYQIVMIKGYPYYKDGAFKENDSNFHPIADEQTDIFE